MTRSDIAAGRVPFLQVAINSNRIDELVTAGKYADAAEAASQAGEFLRAAELYERIWEFAKASASARLGGDLGGALRNALDARDDAAARTLTAELSTDAAGMAVALEILVQRRRFAMAAPIAETLGRRERAVEYFKRANLDLEAARMLAADGRDRAAGRLLERVIKQADDQLATQTAHLRLGLLLARRMQHDQAIRHLQEAAKHGPTRARAERALVLELVALGLRDAARDVLTRARTDDPLLPADIDTFVKGERSAQPLTTSERDIEIVAGRYRLQQLIGAGSSGRVFLAHDEVSSHQVAVKMFNTAYARGRELYTRFVREASVAGALRHPNIVEVYDFSAEAGFTVMEYMTGGSLLERRTAGGDMSELAIRRMALDVVAGLEQAHQRGIIHRDIKPANIFFDARGTAKVGDFGVAHLLDLGQTQTGGLIGTLAYMSPEQITGARLSIAADLYAVGVTLFEVLTGRLPFLGPDFVAQHLGEVPPRVTDIAPQLAPGWDAIVARLLVKDPASRYESIDGLRRDLQAMDLGENAQHAPLILPRARRSSARQAVASAEESPQLAPDHPDSAGNPDRPDHPDHTATTDDIDAARYRFESSLGTTAVSTLSRAVDNILDRSVIVERFSFAPSADTSAESDAIERRLYVLARGGGPFMQRALSYDRPEHVAVFEAPAGAPLAEAYTERPLGPRLATRLLKRLARGVAPLHETGDAHGALDTTHILVDAQHNPTILVAGLGPVATTATPSDDVADIVAVVCAAAGSREPSDAAETQRSVFNVIEPLARALLSELSPMEQGAILTQPQPTTGEQLYSLADAIEIALLKARRRAGKPL